MTRIDRERASARAALLNGTTFAEPGCSWVLTSTDDDDATLVAEHRGQGWGGLWLTRRIPGPSVLPTADTMGKATEDAWAHAVDAIQRLTRMLIDPQPLRERRPPALLQFGASGPPDRIEPKLSVDGDSCGLAFVLALASACVGQPLRSNVATSVACDGFGQFRPVRGIARKLVAVRDHGAGIDTLFVAKEPAHIEAWREAWAILGRGRSLRIEGVESIDEALKNALPEEDITSRLAALATDPCERSRVVAQLFAAAMSTGQTTFLSWGGVARAAAGILTASHGAAAWAEDDRERLKVVFTTAHRWANLEPAAPGWQLPDEAWLMRCAPRERAGIAAQLVQNSASLGIPARADAHRFARHCAHDGTTGLKLQGATARLRAARPDSWDDLTTALGEQAKVARAFAEQFEWAESTYGLSEWTRLAGLCGDRASFDEACAFAEKIEPFGGLARGGAFVELAQVAGGILLAEQLGSSPPALEAIDTRVERLRNSPSRDPKTTPRLERWHRRKERLRGVKLGEIVSAAAPWTGASSPDVSAQYSLARLDDLVADWSDEAWRAWLGALPGVGDLVLSSFVEHWLDLGRRLCWSDETTARNIARAYGG